jgi:hypothetical protein
MIAKNMNEMAVYARINPSGTSTNGYPIMIDDRKAIIKLSDDGWLDVMANENAKDTALSTALVGSAVIAAEKRIKNMTNELIGRVHIDLENLVDILRRQYRRACLKYGECSKQAGQLDALLCQAQEAQNAMVAFNKFEGETNA